MEFTESNLFNPSRENFVEDILENNGINPEMFLNGRDHTSELTTLPHWYYNMEKSAHKILSHIEKESLIGILVDDDADGFTSAAATARLLFKLKHHAIKFIFHDQKSHGLSGEVKKIIDSKINLLIVPDAGSNDFEEQVEILKKGIDIIILDHHDIDNQKRVLHLEEKYPSLLICNNQLNYNMDGVNHHLVGAGMVFKLAQMFDQFEITSIYQDDIIDLVAVGQIGDASDLTDLEIQMIVRDGLDNLKNPLLVEALKSRIEKGQKIAPINMSFDIIPLINSVTRVGTEEEKIELMKGLVGFWPANEQIMIQKRRKNKTTRKFEMRDELWTHYAILMDKLTKIKARQNKEIDKVLKNIDQPYNENIVIVLLDEDEVEYRSITGLIANKLVTQYNKPSLVLVKNEDGTFSGSARGHEKTMTSFRKWCLETENFYLAQGHDNAFGVVISELSLDNLMENGKLKTEVNEVTYEVNKIYKNKVNLDEVELINNHSWLFGGSLQTPKFGYKDLIISRNCISQRGSVVTVFWQGLEFIMYKQSPGIVDEFINRLGFDQKLVVNLVGRPSRNEWNGRVKEQIVLDDYEFLTLSEANIQDNNQNTNSFKDDGELVF